MNRIGIITYHSAYNYGSALQAFATQKAIERITGTRPYIVDYRSSEQKRVYALYRTMHGPKIFLEDLCLMPIQGMRKTRNQRFEDFFKTYMNLTKTAYSSDEAKKLFEEFDIMVSGSDQIWNKYSLELANVGWDEMEPYLLRGYTGKKISYASSIGGMSDEEIERIRSDIESFDYVSCRESISAERVRKLTNSEPSEVLDPTFLLTKDEWIEILDLRVSDEKYVLFYGLGGIGYLNGVLKTLKPYCAERGLKLKVVMPYAYLPFQGKTVEYCTDAGPKELLDLIMHSQMVVTNSYHGTILSVNFEKDMYSICSPGGAEFRKTEILKKLGLQDRIIEDISGLRNIDHVDIDYFAVNTRLSDLRNCSAEYLKNSLK